MLKAVTPKLTRPEVEYYSHWQEETYVHRMVYSVGSERIDTSEVKTRSRSPQRHITTVRLQQTLEASWWLRLAFKLIYKYGVLFELLPRPPH
jgi:hypothetical protein